MEIGAWVFANKKGFIKFIVNGEVKQKNTNIGWEYLSASVKITQQLNLMFKCSEKNNHRLKTVALPTGKEITLVIFDSIESDGHAEVTPILMSRIGENKDDFTQN